MAGTSSFYILRAAEQALIILTTCLLCRQINYHQAEQPLIISAAVLCFGGKFNYHQNTMGIIAHWLLSAASLVIAAYLIPGIEIRGLAAILIAPIVIGFVNATIGFVLKILTLPLTVLTLGLFWLVINALMLQLAAALVPGFYVSGFWAAFFGAIVLSLVNMVLRSLLLAS